MPAMLGIFVILPLLLTTLGLVLRYATEQKTAFPWPSDIIRSFPALLNLEFEGRVSACAAMAITLKRIFLATLISALCGAAFAFLLSWRPWLWAISQPAVDLLRSVPVTFFVPVIALATGSTTAYLPWALAAIPCSLIMLLQIRQGIVDIDRSRIHTFYVLAGTKNPISCLIHVIIPETAPEFIAGLRLSCSYAIVVVSVLEYFVIGSQEIGFGYLIAQVAQNKVDDPRIFSGILMFGIIGLVLNKLLELLETHMTKWKHDHDQS